MPDGGGAPKRPPPTGSRPLFRELLRWMDRTSVPRSRPSPSAADEAAGLVLLDLALRLEHVSRVTDSLRVIDRSHARRSVSLDVDLRGLTGEQRESLAVRRGTTPQGPDDDAPPHLWVPVSRHSRMDLSPVVVRDASDQVLPRLTQAAASRTLVAGLGRLLKVIRESTGAQLTGEAMWLILKALQSLVVDGPLGYDARDPNRAPQPGGSSSVELRRDEARAFLLEDIPVELQQSLDRLIEVAYTEYLLVVMLPAKTSQAHLRFEAPLIPAATRRWTWRRDLGPGREYTIDYRTEIARSLGSYHVTVEVAEEIRVRRYILCTAADRAAVAELIRDMSGLAAVLSAPLPATPAAQDVLALQRRGVAEDEIRWLELESVLSRLARVGRRRNLEYRRYRAYIDHELGRPAATDVEARPADPADDGAVLGCIARGEVTLLLLDRLADISAARPLRDSLREAGLTPQDFADGLAVIGRWLDDARLGEDVIVENDPRENGAHAQWSQQPLKVGTPSLEPIDARVFLTLADEKPALADSVSHMVLGLTAIAAGLGALLHSTSIAAEDVQSDALVAVLLLVPGILLSRLDIPSTNSVLGQLRAMPRNIAYSSVVLTSGLAVAVATGWARKSEPLPFAVVVASLLVCYAATSLETVSRERRRRRLIPESADVPWWLANPDGDAQAACRDRRPTADVVFDAIDGRTAQDSWAGTPSGPLERAAWLRAPLARRRRTPAAADTAAEPDADPDRTSAGRRSQRGADLARAAARTVTAGRSGTRLVLEHRVDAAPRDPEPAADEGRTLRGSYGITARGTARARPELVETLLVRAGRCSVAAIARPLASVGATAPQAEAVRFQADAATYRVDAPLTGGSYTAPLQALTVLIGPLTAEQVPDLLLRLLTDDPSAPPSSGAGAQPLQLGLHAPRIRDVRYPESLPVRTAVPQQAAGELCDMLRVSIAVADPVPGRGRAAPTSRLSRLRQVARLCADKGLALHVNDGGGTDVGPYWRQVVPVADDASTPQDRHVAGRWLPTGPQRKDCLLLTLAGAAAGYDVVAAATLCQMAARAGAGVLMLSVARVQEQPLISLALLRPPRCRLSRRRWRMNGTPSGQQAAVHAVAEFLSLEEDEAHLAAACHGRALLATPLRSIEVKHLAPDDGGRAARRTLWLQWAWPGNNGDRDLGNAVNLVQQSFAAAAVRTAVLDRRVRQDRDGRVRGSARLSAELAAVHGDVGQVAHAIERDVQRMLAEGHRSPHEVRLRIVQDEGWLAGD